MERGVTQCARLFILLACIYTEQHRPVECTCSSLDHRGVLFQIKQNVPIKRGRRNGERFLTNLIRPGYICFCTVSSNLLCDSPCFLETGLLDIYDGCRYSGGIFS